MAQRKIHLVFKTHLDLGFTLPKRGVIDQCFNDFIPKAIELAKKLNRDGETRFRWTVGTFLICEFFRTQSADRCAELTAALERGDLVWHALPFTFEAELMSRSLMDYSLSLSKKLDEAFHRQTISAKLSDVPGQTRGIIAPLCAAGVRFLHIGINSSSAMPDIPPAFIWRDPEGNEIIVQYCRGYGDTAFIDGCDEGLCLCHSQDNSGPPSETEVSKIVAQLKKQYPDAEILISSLDDYARALIRIQDTLPVVTREIGDTWIHGAGSDPMLTAQYRALLNLCETDVPNEFRYRLLTIPEHTWALDSKLYLADYKNWKKSDFRKARLEDTIPEDAYRPESAEVFAEYREQSRHLASYSNYERELAVNRALVDYTCGALPSRPVLDPEPLSALPALKGRTFTIHGHDAEILPDGSLHLNDLNWTLGQVSYEQIGVQTLNRYRRDYSIDNEETHNWMYADFYKPGYESSGGPEENVLSLPSLVSVEGDDDSLQAVIAFPEELCEETGCPRNGRIRYAFAGDEILVTVSLSGKDAHRMPEGIWLSMTPDKKPEYLRMEKLEKWVDYDDVVSRGNRSLHGVTNVDCGSASVRPLDTFLLCPGERRLYNFTQEFADLSGGLHFNLYNNIWSTNYRLWYEEDITARFLFYPGKN